MAKILTISLKSGRLFDHALDLTAEPLSATEACDEFFKSAGIGGLETLKIANAIYFVREIERLEFA